VTASLDYRSAGVDIAAAEAAKRRLRALVDSTRTDGVVGEFGTFGGLFRAPGDERYLLVASADGVGTKVKVAIETGRHDSVGQDLVNHCVNDILTQGALPLFFLDYLAFGKLDPAVAERVVAGVAAGCRENGCALLGGETAEMPGLYEPGDYDLAGFIVGKVREDDLLGPDRIEPGDAILGLASTGLHTNGYSLARRIVQERLGLTWDDPFPGEDGASVADVMLRVHRSYLEPLRHFLRGIHALAHITGGGIAGNLTRILPTRLDAEIELGSWRMPNVFAVLRKAGPVDHTEMLRTFNVGLGMIAVLDPDRVESLVEALAACGVEAWVIGRMVRGHGLIRYRGELRS
jgi:phosphoribosylformylglycinamidine cyclo-ligase